jgi:hypothetical protein
MSNSVKEQISADFQKAKSVGGERIERIRKIFQAALAQTVSELKEGGTEIQSIAKDSTSNLTDALKAKQITTQTSPAPIEVKIEDITDETIVNAITTNDQISASMSDEEIAEAIMETEFQAELAEIEAASLVEDLVEDMPAVEPTQTAAQTDASTTNQPIELPESLKTILDRIMAIVQDEKTQATVKPYMTKISELVVAADQRLHARYGERYESFKQEFKQDIDKTKVWYSDAKADAARAGSFWADRKQAEVETKAGEAGATLAQKEQKIKQLLKELWHTVSK